MSKTTVPATMFTCHRCKLPIPSGEEVWQLVPIVVLGEMDSDYVTFCRRCENNTDWS